MTLLFLRQPLIPWHVPLTLSRPLLQHFLPVSCQHFEQTNHGAAISGVLYYVALLCRLEKRTPSILMLCSVCCAADAGLQKGTVPEVARLYSFRIH